MLINLDLGFIAKEWGFWDKVLNFKKINIKNFNIKRLFWLFLEVIFVKK